MIQLKIINHDGQCRGRPPTGSVGQLDSWTVGSQQSAVGSLDWAGCNVLGAVGCGKSAGLSLLSPVGSQQSAVSSQ